ncbi:MAG: transcriptional regulator [Verrucomicrobia bacterium]|nr:MAG: transcriptional regulator [Verrucomicrobiota bacterium]
MERNICLNWEELVQEAIIRRKQQKLTQKQLAILSGVSGPTVNQFEQGKTNIVLESALKILKCLGLTSTQITRNSKHK